MKYLLIAFFGFAISLPVAAQERIIDTSNGREITRAELISILSEKQFILLGELHDNAMHHQHRGELLAALEQSEPVVVAEHLERGKSFIDTGNLQADLEQAGFDAKGWRWPLHESLFASVRDHKLPLVGGNIPRQMARDAVRQGTEALPAELVAIIAESPLADSDQAALDDDLLKSHCGYLPGEMLEGLRLAQRARDAAMFDALAKTQERPAILLAGNGHVRLDYGIPSLIRHRLADASYVSIGFIEESQTSATDMSQKRDRYHYLWIVAPPSLSRTDPCESFKTRSKDAS